ncbi:MAG: thiol:disulfide interchange protein DsbA/DsbL [Casimicrobiaceae bacterium]
MKTMLWVARSAAALTLISFGALSMAADLEEGKDYRRLAKPQATETGKKIEVIEFFSFSCPHCKDMEPFLSEWIKKLPADVQVRRIPAQFSPPWVGTAKVWYTLEGLNEEKLAPAAFNAIHGQNVRLDQDKPFFDWSATQGLDRKKVEDMYNSFAVNGKVARAKTLVQNYGVQSVPTFVVDGKYTTETGTPKQHADIPALLDKLIDKARAEHAK